MSKESLQQELDEMEKAIEDPDNGLDDFQTDDPGTEVPGTDSISTESPSTNPPGTSAPTTELPAEDPRDIALRELKLEIESLKNSVKKPDPSPTQAPSTSAPLSDEDFLGDIDIDDLTRDPKLFNHVLNKIYKKARLDVESAIQHSGESVIRSIPDIVKSNIALTTTLQKVNKEFYESNKDLIPWKSAVATVFEEKMSENPDRRYDEILPEVATEVRKRLNIKSDTNQDSKPPKLPKRGKNGQRQTTKPDLSDFEKELSKMDDALEKF